MTEDTAVTFRSLLSTTLKATPLPPTGLSLTPLSPWIFWNLWKARNCLIFEDRLFPSQDIVVKSIREAKEWQDAQIISTKLPSPSIIRPPPQTSDPQAFRCFVDAAWCPQSQTCGQGWVLYDPTGHTPRRFSTTRPFVTSALVAEALAMRSSLNCLKPLQQTGAVGKIEFYSDSKILISAINKQASSKELKAILQDITSLSDSFDSVSFNFIPRSDNIVADSVAKAALCAVLSPSPRGV
ncbi:uncharacterized protein LOC111830897 isoform X2 [Capsella rubella]|nr:uncharacterized protein LOC111830897 isoform X2 [Capsella rubella]